MGARQFISSSAEKRLKRIPKKHILKIITLIQSLWNRGDKFCNRPYFKNFT